MVSSDVRVEEFELAFAGFEWQAARGGQHPAERAMKPFGAMGR